MSTYTIERHIEIEAPADVVWRTITEPEQIRTWFSDGVDLEARPGAVGTLTFRADTDDPFVVALTVVAAERPHRFSFRWCYPPGDRATADNSTLVTFTLTAVGDARTRLPRGRDRPRRTRLARRRQAEVRRRSPARLAGTRRRAARSFRRRSRPDTMSDQDEDDDLWEAMADPTRRKLLDLLVVRGQATATTLTGDMPVSRQAISKHLVLLQRVGLIDGLRQGREVRYQVREQRLAEATRALSQVANRWDRRLRTIKQLAEQAHAADRAPSADTHGNLGAP